MWPYFERKLAERGFILLAAGDVGWTYLYTQRPVRSAADLTSMRLWAWQDDPIVRALYRLLDIGGVPLGVPQVLTALESGRVEGCYGAPLAAVALQWHTEVRFTTSMPIAYSMGALVLRREAFEASSPADRRAERELATRLGRRIISRVRADNARALRAMVESGVEIVTTPAELARAFRAASDEAREQLVGSLYSPAELEMALRYRAEFRARARPAP
jgi:TRAP-type C4-dicarboxylate transport system substrate-binding protein